MSFKMSRDSRKIRDILDQYNNVVQASDIMLTDMLMVKYYPQPVINILKPKLKGIRDIQPKHGTVEYWMPMIMNMFGKSTSVMRPNAIIPDWFLKDGAEISFACVTDSYLLTDYGYDDMVMLQRIINTYNTEDIVYACGVGKSNKVYEIRYINAVLEKEYAKKDLELAKIKKLGEVAQSSDRLLNETIHQHTILDMAQVEYNWNKTRENAELERKFNDMMKGGK